MTGYTVATYVNGAVRVSGWYRSVGGAYAVIAMRDHPQDSFVMLARHP